MSVKYPYPPNGREIKYVGIDNKFMQEAQNTARHLSTEHNHPTGAVIVKNGEIIGRGGNQSGLKNPKLQKLHNQKGICVRKWIGAKSGTLYWTCPGCASFSSHGEQMAIKDAYKHGNDTEGADLYLYGHWWCCEPCWNKMIQAGIKNVYLLKNSEILFNRDNVNNIICTQFQTIKAIEEIEKEHKTELESKVRYARYMDGETNKEWVKLLGQDVSFAGHPHVTAKIAKKFIKYDNKIDEKESEQLITAALIHDMGELHVDDDGVGDISYDQKEIEHFTKEGEIFKRIISSIESNGTRTYLLDVYENVARDKTTTLGKVFNAIERIGYIQTGISAYEGVNNKRINNWQGLTGNVFKNHIIPSVEYSSNFPYVSHFLKKNKDTITKILDETDWKNIPTGTDGKPTYELEKIKEAQEAWQKYLTKPSK